MKSIMMALAVSLLPVGLAAQDPTEVIRTAMIAVLDSVPAGDRALAAEPLPVPPEISTVDVERLIAGLDIRLLAERDDALTCSGARVLRTRCTLRGADVLLTLRLGHLTADKATVGIMYHYKISPDGVAAFAAWEVRLKRSGDMWVIESMGLLVA